MPDFDPRNAAATADGYENDLRSLRGQINALSQQMRQLQNALSVATSGTGNRSASVAPATSSGGSSATITATADNPLTVNGGGSATGSNFAFSFSSQTANTVLAAPDGSNGVPTFRLLVEDDLPDSGVTPGTATLLKLTGGGTDGSITVDAKGRVTALVAPT